MIEKAVLFGKTKSLVGIIAEPTSRPEGDCLPAIIILNAGFVHRVGPNRLHVKIAREMATVGHLVLRFDFSGIGDSEISGDNIPFEERTLLEVQQAMDYLGATRNIQDFILVGICSGADIAFRTACCEPRVIGMIGINGYYLDRRVVQQMNPHIKNSTQKRYYSSRLLDYRSWWRLITGKSDFRSIVRFLVIRLKGLVARDILAQPETDLPERWDLMRQRSVDVLLIYSEGSMALDAFHLALKEKLGKFATSGKLKVEIIGHSDHVFTLLSSQEMLIGLLRQWVQGRNVNRPHAHIVQDDQDSTKEHEISCGMTKHHDNALPVHQDKESR